MKVSGTFDIECAEWSRFVVAATWEPSRGVTVHETREAFVDFLLARPGLSWWGHAAGVYDSLLVAEEMRRRGIPCSIDLAGARASRIVGGKIVLRDSWPLVPLPLSQAVELIGETQAQLNSTLLPCSCADPCGGFCSLTRAFKDRRVFRHVAERCASDARQLYLVLRRIVEIGASMDLDLRGTIGGTAWATARRRLQLPDALHGSSEWRSIRRSYYGGRVAVIRPMARRGSHYDLSSAYPAALATTALPAGDAVAYTRAAAWKQLESDRPGVFACRVSVPSLFIPPLPVREPKRIVYPIGQFHGCWTGLELREAIARGAVVESVQWAQVWPRGLIQFEPLMREWWEARKLAGKQSALGAWLRLLANSITGKLAENPDKRVARMFPDHIRMCEAKAPCTTIRCTGACGAMAQLDEWGQIWSVPISRPSPCSHIEWAAHLTASVRIELLRGMESQGANLVYADTDSVWTTDENTAPGVVGPNLGEWEYKAAFRDFECAAPRQYRYTADDCRPITRTAGILVSAQEYGRGFAKNDRGVLSFTEAAATRKGLFVRRNQNWNLTDRGSREGWYGDRRIELASGITYPLRFKHGEQKEA
jgi:hypothetical protein